MKNNDENILVRIQIIRFRWFVIFFRRKIMFHDHYTNL